MGKRGREEGGRREGRGEEGGEEGREGREGREKRRGEEGWEEQKGWRIRLCTSYLDYLVAVLCDKVLCGPQLPIVVEAHRVTVRS